MATVDGLHKRIDSLLESIEQQRRFNNGPALIFLDSTGGAIPGYEQSNSEAWSRAKWLGVARVYTGIDPSKV